MSANIFHMISSADLNNTIVFSASSGIYEDAVKEAFKEGKLSVKNNHTVIKIWVPSLVPQYGPYYYAVVTSNNEHNIINSNLECFLDPDIIPNQYFLGGFNLKNYKNTPFEFISSQSDWIDFFKNNKKFRFYFRNPSLEDIIKHLQSGKKIEVIEEKFMNSQSKYAFQFSDSLFTANELIA